MRQREQRLLLAAAVVTVCGFMLAAGGRNVSGEALRLGARIGYAAATHRCEQKQWPRAFADLLAIEARFGPDAYPPLDWSEAPTLGTGADGSLHVRMFPAPDASSVGCEASAREVSVFISEPECGMRAEFGNVVICGAPESLPRLRGCLQYGREARVRGTLVRRVTVRPDPLGRINRAPRPRPFYFIQPRAPRCVVSSRSILAAPAYGVEEILVELEPNAELDALVGSFVTCSGQPLRGDGLAAIKLQGSAVGCATSE